MSALSLLPHPVSSRWSTGCTVPTTLCKRRPTAPSTVWSIPLTRHWSICGTRGRWRPIRRRLEATWVWQRWWSRASVFPPETRWWEQNTPRYWSSRRRRRSRWGERKVRLHKITSSVFNIWSVKCWASTGKDHAAGFLPLTTNHGSFTWIVFQIVPQDLFPIISVGFNLWQSAEMICRLID